MTATVFVDTNVIVYRHDASDSAKQLQADRWLRHLAHNRSGKLSFQVMQELYSTLTRKLRPGFEAREAQDIVRDLMAWQPVATDFSVMERAWRLQESRLLSWWDALIVAAAQSTACDVLLTEDLQHGQAFGRVRVLDPFESPDRAPAEVLESLAS